MRRNWFHRLLLSYLPVFILIVCLFVFIGIVQLNDLSRKEAMKSSQVYVQNIQNSIDMSLRSIEIMMLETITRNVKLTTFAGMESDSSFIIELSQLLQSMTTSNAWIDSVYIYRSGDGTIVSDKTILKIDQFGDSAYIESNLANVQKVQWSTPRIFRTIQNGNPEERVISISSGVPIHSKGIALLVVNIKMSAIQEFLEKYGNSEVNKIAVTDNEGHQLFGAAGLEAKAGDTTLVSGYTGWTYSNSFKTESIGSIYFYMTSGWFIIGFLGLLIGIGWVVYITRQNYKPIETIMSRIQKYNQVHKHNPIQGLSGDELSYIDYTLSNMIEVSEEYETQSKVNEKYRQLMLFKELVEGSNPIDRAEWEAELRQMGIASFGSASVSIGEIDKYIDFLSQHSRRDQGLFKYILKKVVEETAEAKGLRIWQEWITNHRLCVIFFEEQQQPAESLMLEVSEQARKWMQDNLNLTVTFGLGNTVSEANAIVQSYEAAARALDYKSALGSNRVIGHWEIELLSHDDLYVYLQYVRTIAQAFRVGNDGWEEQLRLLFEGLRRLMLPREEISGILSYMNYYFYREMMELPPDYQELWNREFRTPWDVNMDALETLEELEFFYSKTLTSCARKIEAIRESKGNHGVVQKVKAYIEENFSNPDLSLSSLSDQFHMNASSLSTLFKEDFGEKFVVYVCQVRMEHAKELLRGTNLPIQEISERVGYVHQMSFIRAFKKMIGTTPGDYRKVHQ
ncbi:AraC family transcriptional regulator [Paenibacillus sp. CGMCC 1.16610]|uniref:Helix-turn-helix domain-containing protein n=1 Tax=Paenibacillus anseongense TaxID=2682845 RepID=A0ABW9UIK4_9BACL|nr:MULTISPECIES: AraC family transcriptional regulator [Paenibacillus]MBA2938605.1 AraC family transcriptional regulator [Paenibacillus sp. CGMCC 1.16610]MVQ38796.1 helix-turn-helix domain-containing protein [Paenibacillus anseongense]